MELIDILISGVLALIMFGVGTSLKTPDFQLIYSQPKTFFLGLSMQMLFLPVLAFIICIYSPIDNLFKVGIMILSLCPGGATSNFISYLLNLKTALSICLTVFNSILILITIPLGVNFASHYFLGNASNLSLSISDTLVNVVFIILLPAILGLLFNRKFEAFTSKVAMPIKFTSTFLLGMIFVLKIFAEKEQGGSGIVFTEAIEILPSIFILHILSMVISFSAAKKLGVEKDNAITIAIEVGLQNTTLALFISSVILGNDPMSKPAIVYGVFSFFTTVLFGYLAKRSVGVSNH